jgi:NOL1/NOP2/sun family putative RNA methylase
MEKYREIIDDWEAFERERENHPVNIARKNTLKASEDFEEELRNSFENVEDASWNEKIYRLKDTETPGKTALHWRGEYYVQEESAALPVEALNPQSGEKVLDMCAAPGGKATQIAEKMKNEGLVVANDDSAQRMKSLHANIYRTGSTVITATNRDGRAIPEDEKYDRILVDAPCSGEGDRFYRSFEPATKEEIEGIAELQKQLVDKARKLLKEEGVMIYSTCTLNPEENEEVVKHLLEQGMQLEGLEPSFEHVSGVKKFEGENYGEEMRRTVRIYPHHLNSGVIFVARLRKN